MSMGRSQLFHGRIDVLEWVRPVSNYESQFVNFFSIWNVKIFISDVECYVTLRANIPTFSLIFKYKLSRYICMIGSECKK